MAVQVPLTVTIIHPRSREITVTQGTGDGALPLRPIRPGFFAPLWQVAPFGDRPLEFDVVGDPAIRKMLFPKRDFWVLVRDPESGRRRYWWRVPGKSGVSDGVCQPLPAS